MPDGGEHFAALNALLRDVGTGMPRFIIDLDRLDANLEQLLELHPPEDLRIVARSLPSHELLAYVFKALGHERLMAFHLPFLLQIVELARTLGKRITVSVELDIGMHRGGARSVAMQSSSNLRSKTGPTSRRASGA